jgi:hypothetical protein
LVFQFPNFYVIVTLSNEATAMRLASVRTCGCDASTFHG